VTYYDYNEKLAALDSLIMNIEQMTLQNLMVLSDMSQNLT